MWRRLSRFLEAIGFPILPEKPSLLAKGIPPFGNPQARDSSGGDGWKEFRTAERLFEVWGPVPGSPWEPFHCPTLFAALDRANPAAVGPAPAADAAAAAGRPRISPPPAEVGFDQEALMLLDELARLEADEKRVLAAAVPSDVREKALGAIATRRAEIRAVLNPPAPASAPTSAAAAVSTAPTAFLFPASAPEWAGPGAMAIVDLPGPWAVEAAAWLVESGFQPVSTFDNWPDRAGLLRPEWTLAVLLHHAARIARARASLAPGAPPVWICDSMRLVPPPGQPNDFDNRYYIDDSILPGPALLRAAGVRRVVYVDALPDPPPDVGAFLHDLARSGFEVLRVSCSEKGVGPAQAFAPPPVVFRTWTFRRSDAGGFGVLIPEPSSSGG